MPASFKPVLLLLPVIAIAACTRPYYDQPTVVTQPPPPAMLNGALGAPIAPEVPVAGSTVPPSGPLAMPNAPMRMSATDITSAFVNNTAEGVTTNGTPYAIYFTADGRQRFQQGSFRDSGTWQVLPDGRFCSSLSQVSNGNQECYYMYRKGSVITFERPDGVTVGNVNVLAGDPEAL